MKKAILITLSIFCLIACKEAYTSKDVSSTEITFRKDADALLVKPTGATVQKLEIEIAKDNYSRETGLMHRKSMRHDRGMLFEFPDMSMRSFYMKNTYIALDLIYLDADLKIVSFQENAKPLDESSLPSQVPAQYILEINAGLAEEWGLDVGDRLTIIE